MPEEAGIAARLAGALLQIRSARGAMPDEKEAVQIYLAVLNPHSRLGYRSPREYILSQPLRVRFDGVNSKLGLGDRERLEAVIGS